MHRDASSQVGVRTCPICGTATEPTDTVVRAPIRANSLEAYERDQYWRGFRKRQCFFDYAQCRSCGLLFCPTYYTQSSLDQLYSSMPDNTAGEDTSVLNATQVSYIDYLARYQAITGTYLEIGPDIGLSTRAACERGGVDRAILVEPNRGVHEQLMASAGDVPAQIFESLDQLDPTDQADSVVLIHVLDHLIDPLKYLQTLRAHVPTGAVLLAVVHNETSLLRHLLGTRWPPFCLQHPQLYSSATLARLFSEAGFAVLGSSPTKNVWTLQHFVKTGVSLVGISGDWTDHIPETKVRIRLGNVMMVARA